MNDFGWRFTSNYFEIAFNFDLKHVYLINTYCGCTYDISGIGLVLWKKILKLDICYWKTWIDIANCFGYVLVRIWILGKFAQIILGLWYGNLNLNMIPYPKVRFVIKQS